MMSRKLSVSFWHLSGIVVVSVLIGIVVGIYIKNNTYDYETSPQASVVEEYTQLTQKPLVGWKGVELESDTPLMDRKYAKTYALHRRGSEIATIGDRYIYYLGYCGSGCQRFVVVNLANGKMVDGVLSYINYGEDKREWYVLFDDWHGNTHRFDGELAKITPSLKEKDIVFSFLMKDSRGEYVVRYPLADFE